MSATMNDVVTKMSNAEKRKIKLDQGRQAAVQWAVSRTLTETDQVRTALHWSSHPDIQYTDEAKALVASVNEVGKDYAKGFFDAVDRICRVREEVLDRLHRAQGMIDGMRWAKEFSSAEGLRRMCSCVNELDPTNFTWMPNSFPWASKAHLLASLALGVAPTQSDDGHYVVDWDVCWKFWQPFIDDSGTTFTPKKDEETSEKLLRFTDCRYTTAFVVGAYAVAKNITRDIDVLY